MTQRIPRWIQMAAAVFVATLSTACNLDLETEDYPYRVSLIIDVDGGTDRPDLPTGADDAGEEDAGAEDMAPPGEPELVITEILINTSVIDTGIAFGELGEFVELKNVGDGPADPRAISMRLTNVNNDTSGDIFISTAVTQEQLEVIRGLKPIMPGEYFVFVRYSNDEVPVSSVIETGRYYDYGRYGEGVAISNSDERVLEVRYNNGEEIIASDRIRWRSARMIASNGSDAVSLEFGEDVSLTVRPGNELATKNNSPADWCVSPATFGGIATGSPGSAGQCQD